MTGSGHNFGGPNPIGGGPGPGASPPLGPQPDVGWQSASAGRQQPGPGWRQPDPSWGWPYPGPEQSFGAAPPGAPTFSPPPAHAAADRRRRRRRIVLSCAVALVVAIAVVAGIAVFTTRDSGGPVAATTPDGAVKAYFDALRRGDADAALALSLTEPADKTFLTNEVLKKQIDNAPISNVQILRVEDDGRVRVTATFGERAFDETVTVKQDTASGQWKLERTWAVIDIGEQGAADKALIDTVTLFGQKMPSPGRALVFPGWIEFGNTNSNLESLVSPPLVPLGALWRDEYSIYPEFRLTDDGRKAVEKAVLAALSDCAKSRSLQPKDCPQRVSAAVAIDGTAQWTAPSELESISVPETVQAANGLSVVGRAVFLLTVDTPDPRDRRFNEPLEVFFQAKVDIASDPPTVTFPWG